MSLREIGERYGCSKSLVVKICKDDPAFEKQCTQKRIEIETSVLQHMAEQKPKVNELLDSLLENISNKDKQAAASLRDLATTMGIIIDKYTSFEQAQAGSGSLEDDPITKSIKESLGKKDVK